MPAIYSKLHLYCTLYLYASVFCICVLYIQKQKEVEVRLLRASVSNRMKIVRSLLPHNWLPFFTLFMVCDVYTCGI